MDFIGMPEISQWTMRIEILTRKNNSKTYCDLEFTNYSKPSLSTESINGE